MPKIVPLRRDFENVLALLASMAEMPDIVGFVGCAILDTGDMAPVSYGADVGDFALAGVILHKISGEESIDDTDS